MTNLHKTKEMHYDIDASPLEIDINSASDYKSTSGNISWIKKPIENESTEDGQPKVLKSDNPMQLSSDQRSDNQEKTLQYKTSLKRKIEYGSGCNNK